MTENEWLYYGSIILFFIVFSGFFSASETALTAITKARLFNLMKDGNKRAAKVSKLREEKEALIGSILIGNNLVNIAASALATSLAIRIFGNDGEGLTIATLTMTVIIVIFAEILPKTYAIQNSEKVCMAVATPLSFLVKILNPISRFLQKIIQLMLRLFGVDLSKTNSLLSASDLIRSLIEVHHNEGEVVKHDRDMLGSILDLDEIVVEDIMIHRKQVDTLDVAMEPHALVEAIFSMMHSRIPLWEDDPDNIIGVLHVKDLALLLHDPEKKITTENIRSIMHAPWFIPETTSLRDQLLAFRARRQHFALVVDEYGAFQGIVTLEDIIEEIVGEIDDEHDELTAGDIQKAGENTYFIAGEVTLRDLNRELDWNLPDDNASTIAGLVVHEAEDLPAKGEEFMMYGFRITVIDKTNTQLKRLRIEKIPDTLAEELLQ